MLTLALVMTMAGHGGDDTGRVVLGVVLWSALPALFALVVGRLVRKANAIEHGGAATGRAGLSFGVMYTLAVLALWLMMSAVLSIEMHG